MTFSTFSSPGVSLQGGSGGGTPGGSTTQIQYNNAGAFAGASGLTTNGTNLTFGSASQLLWSTDLILTRRGAANLRFGAADAAAPVAQTLSVQSVVTGTTDTAGGNFTITGSQGTGTGAGGSIIFQVAPAGGSGLAQNVLATALTIGSNPSFGSNVAVTLGGGNTGVFTVGNTTTSIMLGYNGASDGASGILIGSTGRFAFTNGVAYGGTSDVSLFRDAAGIMGLRGSSTASPGAMSFYSYGASPPAAPGASIVRLYADTSGGKTRLMALFNTAPAVEIAIEP
jgi:hypothetical protein